MTKKLRKQLMEASLQQGIHKVGILIEKDCRIRKNIMDTVEKLVASGLDRPVKYACLESARQRPTRTW